MLEISIHYPVSRILDSPAKDAVRFELILPRRPLLFWSDRMFQTERIPLPKGYGVAWYDFVTDRVLMAPLPFNVLVAAGIFVWFLLKYRFAYNLSYAFKRILGPKVRL